MVLISDSGGVAELLTAFVAGYRKDQELHAAELAQCTVQRERGEQVETPRSKRTEIPPKFRKQFEPMRAQLEKIAALDMTLRKIHTFSLGDTTTDDHLDDHLLNAVINDAEQCPPQARLKLAVEWQREAVVRQVLQEQPISLPKKGVARHPSGHGDGRLDVRVALQTAVANRFPRIVQLLLAQDAQLVRQLDFVALYTKAIPTCRLMAMSTRLQDDLLEAQRGALRQGPTSVARYQSALGAFLEPLVPDIAERLQLIVDSSHPKASDSAPHATSIHDLRLQIAGRAETPVPEGLGIEDIIVWAVLVRDLKLVRAFWEMTLHQGDPIRTALIAASTAVNAGAADPLNATEYQSHALMYRQWALGVLNQCTDKDDGIFVLRRPSQHGWPSTMLRLAVDTNAKVFVGQKHVQTLVDETWRGNTVDNEWSLPDGTHPLQLIAHIFWPTVDLATHRLRRTEPRSAAPVASGLGRWPCSVLYGHFTSPAYGAFFLIPQVCALAGAARRRARRRGSPMCVWGGVGSSPYPHPRVCPSMCLLHGPT